MVMLESSFSVSDNQDKGNKLGNWPAHVAIEENNPVREIHAGTKIYVGADKQKIIR